MSGIDLRSGGSRRTAPSNDNDLAAMRLALSLGARGLGQCWPNPAVGAVVADGSGRILGCGWTAPGGRPHAEAIALQQAGPAARGATLYCTLEPCSHWGKTPPCAGAIVEHGVARVVYGVGDPDPRVSGRGLERLRAAGVEVVPGPLPKEARWLNLGHELRVTAKRPFIQMKLAVDRAGLIPAGGGGMPVWATSEEARAMGHMLRAQADAIMVGYGTALADDPDLTCRLPGMAWRSPVRVVLSTEGRLSPHARMLKNLSTAPVWMISAPEAAAETGAAFEEAGLTMLTAPRNAEGRLDLRAAMRALAEAGVTRLLVEGGPSLEANLLKEGLADEVVVFQGERQVRGPSIKPFAPDGLERLTASPIYRLYSSRQIGRNKVWVYRKREFWRD